MLTGLLSERHCYRVGLLLKITFIVKSGNVYKQSWLKTELFITIFLSTLLIFRVEVDKVSKKKFKKCPKVFAIFLKINIPNTNYESGDAFGCDT